MCSVILVLFGCTDEECVATEHVKFQQKVNSFSHHLMFHHYISISSITQTRVVLVCSIELYDNYSGPIGHKVQQKSSSISHRLNLHPYIFVVPWLHWSWPRAAP